MCWMIPGVGYPVTNLDRDASRRSPAGRALGQMVYDAESDRLILFGGFDAALQPLDDVWAYDFNTDSWEQVAEVGRSLEPEHGL